ncbi:unnamed protein product [Urochloa humidicola]
MFQLQDLHAATNGLICSGYSTTYIMSGAVSDGDYSDKPSWEVFAREEPYLFGSSIESAATCFCRFKVWEHVCEVDSEARQTTFPERTNPCWELELDGSKNLLLKELQLVGFRPLEQQITFIRVVLERAPNLKRVVLKEDTEPCEDCDAIGNPSFSLTGHAFPKNKGDQDAVVKKITDGIVSSAQIF